MMILAVLLLMLSDQHYQIGAETGDYVDKRGRNQEVTARAVCPSGVNFSPCSCSSFTLNTVTIDCSNLGLNDPDNAIQSVLNNLPIKSVLMGRLLLQSNSLTRVPDLSRFITSNAGCVSNTNNYCLFALNLSNNPITTMDFTKFPVIRSLRILIASNLSITSLDLGSVSASNPYLCQVDFSFNKQLTTVTNAGFGDAPLGCGFSTSVTNDFKTSSFLLNDCAITQISAGSKPINVTPYNQAGFSAIVNLSNNVLTSVDGLNMFVKASGGNTVIDISGNQITSISKTAIKYLSGSLQITLNLSHNNITV